MERCSLLIVDDEPYILSTLAQLLAPDYEVVAADSAESAQRVLQERPIDMILTDQRMPRMSGIQLLEWVRAQYPQTIRLLMTGYAELEEAVKAINVGHVYAYFFKPIRQEELQLVLRNAAERFCLEHNRRQLVEELRQLNQELEKRVAERTQELVKANRLLQQRTAELERLALTDPLTQLLNRKAIEDIARAELRRHTRYRNALALGIIDADHFREINRRYLLPGGDQVLISLARTLRSSLRTVDSVGRIGGEEFLVVAPETTLEGAQHLAERIRSTAERTPASYRDETITVTVSVGFAVAGEGIAAEYEQLQYLAAQALSEAKNTGRNRCIIRAL